MTQPTENTEETCSFCGEPLTVPKTDIVEGIYYVCENNDFCSALDAGICAYEADIERSKERWVEESPLAIGW